MAVNFKGFSEYTKEFRDPKQRQRNPDEELFAGMDRPNLDMNIEPPIQRKKRFNGFPISKSSMEPPFQRKKRSESASPIRQALEPELQRRKKPLAYKKTAPIATERPSAGNQQDDYMLLGDQSKFNENVKYRIRSRSGNGKDRTPERRPHRPNNIIPHHHPNPSNDAPKRSRPLDRPQNPVPPLNAPHKERQSRSKERAPPPRVVVDTGKPVRATGKGEGGLKLDLGKERSAPQKGSSGEQNGHDRVVFNHPNPIQKGILRKSAATQSTPRLLGDVESDHHLRLRETKTTIGVPLKHSQDHPSAQKTEKRHRDEERSVKKSEEKRTTDKEHNSNQQRTTASSALPPNYAVKYRLGIAPHRSSGPIRFSEYQREFQWRDAIKASPLISAETVVYKSHPDLTLFRSSSMAEDSEYKAQFKAWTPSEDETRNKKNDPPQNKQPSSDQKNKPKMRRSKSLKEMSTQPKPQTGVVSTAVTDSSVTVKHAESDDGRAQDGRPKKKYRSEYSRNFVAPSNYLYDEGAWKKVHAKEEEKKDGELPERPSTAPPPPSASWYAEVLELRRFADEYRKRAQGTHFSREHLAQLYAKNAELWDTLSNGSVLSARPTTDDQNRLHPGASVAKKSIAKTQNKFGTKATPLLAAEEEISARSESITATGSSYSEADKENAYPAAKTRPPPPPPVVQQRKRPHLAHQTTHLTHQTTHLTHQPSSGIHGQIIPSRDFGANHSDSREDSLHGYNSDEGSGRDSESSGYGHEMKVTKVKGGMTRVVSSKEKTANQLRASQLKSSVSRPLQLTTTIAGLPTRDTHVLVNDNTDHEDNHEGRRHEGHHHQGHHHEGHHHEGHHHEGLHHEGHHHEGHHHEGHYHEGYHHEGHHHEGHRHEERWKTGGGRGGGGATMVLKDKAVQIEEDDLMSVSSARSLASSCSLASEVLERARSRRDEFWK